MRAGTGKIVNTITLLLLTAIAAVLFIAVSGLKRPLLQAGNWPALLVVVMLAGVLFFLQRLRTDLNGPEEKTVKDSRLYFLASQLNQMMVRTSNEATLFKEACRIAVGVGHFRMAWIGMIDEETQQIIPLAHAGEETGYLSEIVSGGKVLEGSGPVSTALRQGKYIVCNDIERDAHMAPRKNAGLARGYRSSIALPIIKSGKISGAFVLYASVKNFFDAAEIALLEEITGNISFALEVYEREMLRKKAEGAVLESERRYQTLCEISPVGIFHTDANGYTTYVNPAWCGISGLPYERALGNGWLEAVHETDKEALYAGWEEATGKESSSISEYRFVRPDGAVAWVIGQAIPELNHENQVVGYVGTITDITERKIAEEEIQREKHLSDSIINSLPGTFYLCSKKGKFLRWNTNFEKVTHYSAEEIRQMRPPDFFDAGERHLVAQAAERVFLHGEDTIEARLLLKTGEQVPYYFTGIAIEYEGEICLMGVGFGISERLEAQEKIKETSQQLRQLAAHLQEIREEERASMAREIHDELGQQLTGLKMDVYWLREGLAPAERGTRQQVDTILTLLDQTITTVRKISAALRPFILDDLGLIEALQAHGREFQNRFGIEVTFTTNLEDIPVSPKMGISLFRIFQESLTNVARHAEATSVACTMTRSGNTIVLSIKDNGKGFDMSKTAGKKTLGLLGMKERILMMEGKFDIDSRPGVGTEIIVTVPLQPDIA